MVGILHEAQYNMITFKLALHNKGEKNNFKKVLIMTNQGLGTVIGNPSHY